MATIVAFIFEEGKFPDYLSSYFREAGHNVTVFPLASDDIKPDTIARVITSLVARPDLILIWDESHGLSDRLLSLSNPKPSDIASTFQYTGEYLDPDTRTRHYASVHTWSSNGEYAVPLGTGEYPMYPLHAFLAEQRIAPVRDKSKGIVRVQKVHAGRVV